MSQPSGTSTSVPRPQYAAPQPPDAPSPAPSSRPPRLTHPVLRAVVAVGRALRATVLVVAATLALFAALEIGFRAVRAFANRGSDAPPPRLAGDPRAEAWWAEWRSEFEAASGMGWRPYVYFRRTPVRGRYVNIDSLGRRVTPQPAASSTADQPALRVFLFGGSTMWGEPLREDRTIAAEVARRLQALAGAGRRIEVTNYGESGYVTTQGLLTLMQELRAGRRPDVVLFYDGLNDVGSTLQANTPGVPLNEINRANEFALGRQINQRTAGRDLPDDLRALRALGNQAFRRLALVQWARSRSIARAQGPARITLDSAARGTLAVYAENVAAVEALGARHGFTPAYVWQPNLHTSAKVLNPYEKQLRDQIARDPYQSRVQAVHRLLPPLLDSAMRDVAPGRFVNTAGLFAGDTLAVYVDQVGHNTEASIPRIVDAFWPTLEGAARARLAARAGR